MRKIEVTFLYASLAVTVAGILFFFFHFYQSYYPFENSIVETVVPTNKKSYTPGEYVAFHMDACYEGIKYGEVNYQLEGDPKEGHLYYVVLGSFKSISRDGCFKLIDLNAKIPNDLFERSEFVKEGKHRLYVTITEPQNPTKPVMVYQSDWFEIRREK